jgi:hypothetical protein
MKILCYNFLKIDCCVISYHIKFEFQIQLLN